MDKYDMMEDDFVVIPALFFVVIPAQAGNQKIRIQDKGVGMEDAGCRMQGTG